MRTRSGIPDTAQITSAFEDVRADYVAGKITRFQRRRTGIDLQGSGADYHYRTEAHFLRSLEYARDMVRNDTVVGAIVDRSVTNIFQNGFGFDPQTGDAKLDADLAEWFLTWSSDPAQCDSSGRFTLDQLAWLGGSALKVDGDIFYLPLSNGTLQTVEAHRCRTPSNTTRNVVHGVHLDDQRRPTEYWFTADDVDPWQSLSRVSDVIRYPARGPDGEELVFHVCDPKRFSQTRGVTAFAPVFDTLGMFEDIGFAQLVKAQVAACFVIIRNRPMPGFPGTRGQVGPQSTETMSDGNSRLVESLSPGAEVEARPGETIEGFSPNVPNAEFFDHARLTLQLICAAVNLPVACFLLDGRETNFSGQRFASDQAKIGWRREQAIFAQKFYRKVYRWKVQQMIRSDFAMQGAARKLGDGIYRVRFNAPCWPYMQPVQDIEAKRKEREALLTSPRRQLNERAADWSEVIAETVQDYESAIMSAIEAAQRVEKATGYKIDPARFLYLNPIAPLSIGTATPTAAAPTNGDGSGNGVLTRGRLDG